MVQMKKAVFDIAKTFVFVICAYITGNSALAQTSSASSICPEPPTYIQIYHQFDWFPVEQKRLMRDFQLKCGLPEDFDWLVKRTEKALKARGIRVIKSELSMATEFEQVKIELKTDKDDGQPRSILFPVKFFELDNSLLSHAEISGIVREDETLELRYVLDESRIRDPNSRVVIQWLRDGQRIEGANKSRYKLTSEDVGGKITALVFLRDSRKIVYSHRKVTLANKVGMVISLPEAKGLTIEGEAVVGKVVNASYVYADRNEIDREENSRFVWLRDGFVIKNERGPSYQIVPQDVGKRISVRLTPRNIRNEIGQTLVAEMEQIVEDELVTLRPDILAGIESVSGEMSQFETLKVPKKVFSEFDQVKVTSKEMAKPNSKETSDIYLMPELSIHHASTRKITDIVFYPNDPFTKSYSENIRHQFFGNDISFATIKILLNRLNSELRNSNYDSIEAYLPEQIVNGGVLRVQFKNRPDKVGDTQEKINKEISGYKILLMGLGLVCCL
tara:strand:+ start:3365 stop:4873 length:1509 start_codon:yes stop_codon:yes gene_type:complete